MTSHDPLSPPAAAPQRPAAPAQSRTAPALAPRFPKCLEELRAELLRAGVERMLAQALEVEAELHISRHRELRDASGRRLVVRNGYLPPRRIVCGAGSIGVHQPRIHDARLDARGRRIRFTSLVLPAYARKATCIARPAEAVFFQGLATGDLSGAFRAVFGAVVDELPQSFLPRLGEVWSADRERLSQRAFDGGEHAQLWADAVPAPPHEPGDARGVGGAPSDCLVLAATTPDGVDVLDVRLGRAQDAECWSQLLAELADRGLAVRFDRIHASAPEATRAAFARHPLRRIG
jgi:transposase-like protein